MTGEADGMNQGVDSRDGVVHKNVLDFSFVRDSLLLLLCCD